MNLKRKKTVAFIISVIINLLLACAIVIGVSRSLIVFRGSDTMYHIYRGDWILSSIESGDGWPLYNPVWYNGVELMRYWPPVAAYLMAFCQFVARGIPSLFTSSYVLEGFAIYCGVIYLIGAISWNVAGFIKNRPVLGIVFGAMWFFMPQSLHVLFVEGNLPRSLILAFFPLAFVLMNEYLKKGGVGNYVGTTVLFAVMCMCHVGYTGMVALACLLYIVIYRLCCFSGSTRLQHSGKRDLELVGAIAGGFLLSGVFFFPAIRGGLASNTSSAGQAADNFFQSIVVTLNPVRKYNDGYGRPYFGIAFFLLSIFGCIAGKRRSRAGFVTAIIIILLTTSTAAPIIKALPGGSLMWMLRFLPIGQAMVIYSMLEWDSLKKPVLAVTAVLLALDSVLCVAAMRPKLTREVMSNFFEDMEESTLVDEAKSITDNRIALLDSNRVLINGVFYLTDYEGSVNQLFGQGWEAASTSTQIAQMNEAFDNGYYYFLFDRLFEFGCDTVLVRKDAAAVVPYNEAEAEEAATARGYVKEYDEGSYVVFHHKDVDGTYGTVSKYEGLAIGTGSYYVTMMMPAFAEAPSGYIDDFTLDELKEYKVIYLDGFMYHDIDVAEDLILKASEAGVQIYISADGIPENKGSRTKRFLGVECQSVEFDNGFPTLKMKGREDIDAPLFPVEYKNWKTVYINGLTEELGWAEILDQKAPFYGKGENENITFVGFNLPYYYSLTKDRNIGGILGEMYSVSEKELPMRQAVPLEITYSPNSITVVSPEDNVNTNLAEHDIFKGDFRAFNRLVYVDSGETVITYSYPYLMPGILITVAGVAMTAIMAVFISKKRSSVNI